MAAPLSSWPWESLGSYKNLLYGIFLAKAIYSRYQEDPMKDTWCLHIFIICCLRIFMYHLWTCYANMLFFTRNRLIIKKGVDFKQIDKEWDWDNFILLQAIVAAVVLFIFPTFESLPLWNRNGFTAALVLHVAISEPLFYTIYLIPILPVCFIMMVVMWAKSKAFLVSFYNLRNRLHQTWVVPRFGFQYFLPFAAKGINDQIEEAILRANKLGVKNEALNGGGTLFVNKHPDLKVRVVHGNTLTAAVILHEIPKDVTEVFLTGATSKLGRAIALYLCKKGIRVLTWIVGKWITPREQNFAPSGAHFHQFVVPPILQFRRDCTYGDLAAMRLPEDVEGLGSCEYIMGRGVVHACHGGGVVHSLEGWTHHEVGALDVDRIDLVWEAAMKHGLKPVSTIKT